MADPDAWLDFRGQIDAALELLGDREGPATDEKSGELTEVITLPSLLEQCRAVAVPVDGVSGEPTARPVMRTLHHFACTGGTLISRCTAAMPNTLLLSEVDPLTTMVHRAAFMPTDLIGLVRRGSRAADQDLLVEIFLAGLGALAAEMRRIGSDLILRDHAHSHFCFGPTIPERPSLRAMLARDYRVLSLITVRHPLDSFLALGVQDWLRIEPPTLQEYARRYGVFLDHYAEVPLLRYEDFVTDPESSMQRVCGLLELSYNPEFREMFPVIALSGDSGRQGSEIAPRPRREVPQDVATEAARSESYVALCARLGYDPDPEHPPAPGWKDRGSGMRGSD